MKEQTTSATDRRDADGALEGPLVADVPTDVAHEMASSRVVEHAGDWFGELLLRLKLTSLARINQRTRPTEDRRSKMHLVGPRAFARRLVLAHYIRRGGGSPRSVYKNFYQGLVVWRTGGAIALLRHVRHRRAERRPAGVITRSLAYWFAIYRTGGMRLLWSHARHRLAERRAEQEVEPLPPRSPFEFRAPTAPPPGLLDRTLQRVGAVGGLLAETVDPRLLDVSRHAYHSLDSLRETVRYWSQMYRAGGVALLWSYAKHRWAERRALAEDKEEWGPQTRRSAFEFRAPAPAKQGRISRVLGPLGESYREASCLVLHALGRARIECEDRVDRLRLGRARRAQRRLELRARREPSVGLLRRARARVGAQVATVRYWRQMYKVGGVALLRAHFRHQRAERRLEREARLAERPDVFGNKVRLAVRHLVRPPLAFARTTRDTIAYWRSIVRAGGMRLLLAHFKHRILERQTQVGRFRFFGREWSFVWLHTLMTATAFHDYSRRKRQAADLIARANPDIIVMFEDNVQGLSRALAVAASKRNLPYLVLPQTIPNPKEPAAFYGSSPAHDGRRLIARILCMVWPRWQYLHNGMPMIRLPPMYILAAHCLGLAPRRPWILNDGEAKAICIESEATRRLYVKMGFEARQLVVCGHPIDDTLHDVLQARAERLRALEARYQLLPGRPLVVVGFPPDQYSSPDTSRFEFQDFETMCRTWCVGVATLTEVANVIICRHPRLREDQLSAFVEAGIPIATEPTEEILPLASLYIACISATIRWALAAGIATINYDSYRYNYGDFRAAKGVVEVDSIAKFATLIARLVADSDAWREMSRDAQADAHNWGLLDSQFVTRMEQVITSA